MAQLPFVRDIIRRSQLRPVIKQLNPQRGNSATAGIAGIPKVGVGNLRHMAGGGMVKCYSGQDDSLVDDSTLGMPQGWQSPATMDQSVPTGSSADNPQVSMPSPDMQGIASSPAAQQPHVSITNTPDAAPSRGSDNGGTKVGNWLNSSHLGGFKGSDLVKAGLILLSGIGSGIANKKAGAIGKATQANNAPKIAPTFSPIGVPLAFRNGGQVPGNVYMNSPQEPAVRMATGGPVSPNIHMNSPMEPAVYMAHGGIASQSPAPGGTDGGMLHGPGDGMSDGIAANGGNIRVADKEYVMPADVVAMAGNGSSEAGGKLFDAAVAHFRKMKYGRAKQPPAVSPANNPIVKAMR